MPERPPVLRGRRRGARTFWWVLLGSLLLQLAYTAVVPAFRGSDEFDHVYKADSVAHGQWFGTVDTPRGRGQLLEVSADIQQAARSWCRAYDYTEPDDCRVVDRVEDDRVLVSSAAAAYNPVYYAVVGTVARPFAGESALWMMRLTTMLASSLLLAAAARVIAGWSRTPWPGIAFVLACTPTLVYSGAVVAPNGVGYAAALLWWSTAVAVCGRPTRGTWALFTVAGLLTVACHSTNPMWLPLMCVTLLVLRPPRHWWATLRSDRWAGAAAASLTAATLACLAWARLVGTHATPEGGDTAQSFPWDRLVGNEVAWHLQAVAAFPLRNDQLPSIVYPLWLGALLVLLAVGFRSASGRTRAAMGVIALGWFLVPLALTFATYRAMDFSWQGRYALPLVVGLPLLAAAALDSRRAPVARYVVAVTVVLTAALHAVCVAETVLQERARSISTQLSELVPGGAALAVVLALAGAALLGAGATAGARQEPLPADVPEADREDLRLPV